MIIIEIMIKILRRLKEFKIIEIILVLQLSLLCVIVLLQVIFRYILNFPLAWTDEAARFLFIWVIILAGTIAIKKKEHFSVNIVVKKFSKKVQNKLQFVTDVILFILFFDIMVLKGVYLIKLGSLQISPALHIQMSYVYSSLFIGGILSCCYILEDILSFIKGDIGKI
jgi:TRAP-type C4-dicarboxylate transport system permease small subunit